MKTKPAPNTVLPKGAKLIKPKTVETGTWYPQVVDAKVERLGLTWYRIKGGMGRRGDREDWIAAVSAIAISVHDYHWNGEDFGPSHGSFDNAIVEETKTAFSNALHRLKDMKHKVACLETGIAQLKKALGK